MADQTATEAREARRKRVQQQSHNTKTVLTSRLEQVFGVGNLSQNENNGNYAIIVNGQKIEGRIVTGDYVSWHSPSKWVRFALTIHDCNYKRITRWVKLERNLTMNTVQIDTVKLMSRASTLAIMSQELEAQRIRDMDAFEAANRQAFSNRDALAEIVDELELDHQWKYSSGEFSGIQAGSVIIANAKAVPGGISLNIGTVSVEKARKIMQALMEVD